MSKVIELLKNLLFVILIGFICFTNVYADEYPDDIYDGDYSIEDMLKNYSVVTFGQKDYDSNVTKLRGQSPGSLKIFHVIGNFIVKGDLAVTFNRNFNGSNNDYSVSYGCGSPDSANYEFCKSRILNGDPSFSYKSLGDNRLSYFEGNATNRFSNCPNIYNNNEREYYTDKVYAPSKRYYCRSVMTSEGNYINIERLYSKITEEQNKIKKGKFITSENGVAHIKTGGEYCIDDINEIDSIVFDEFEENVDNLTIITINNIGNIDFPKIYDGVTSSEGIIPTNDSFDSSKPNNSYPGNYVLSKYKGNIIWNIPNASYIKMSTTPFVGHLIAPKADVEGDEFHFAGSFLVNSLAFEGNTEAHFYPLNKEISYRSSIDNYAVKTNFEKKKCNIRFNNNNDLDAFEEGMIVSFSIELEEGNQLDNLIIVDEQKNNISYNEIGNLEYEFEMPSSDVTITPVFREDEDLVEVPNTLIKPEFAISLSLVVFLVIGTYLYRKNESKKI